MGLGGHWLSEENGELTNTNGLMKKLSDPLLGEPRIGLAVSQLPVWRLTEWLKEGGWSPGSAADLLVGKGYSPT